MRNTTSDHKRRRSPTPRSESSSSISVNTSLSSSSSESRSRRSSSSGSKRHRRKSPRSPQSSSRSPPRGKEPSARRPEHVRARSPPHATTSRAEPAHAAGSRVEPLPGRGVDRPADLRAPQKPPPIAGGVPLSSDNVRKLGATKADSDDKDDERRLTEKEEMDLYLKAARERIGSWNPGSPPSTVAAEVQRVLSERFAKGVSQRGVSLLTSLLDDLCLSASHMTEVVDVLSQRLASSHAAWENDVRSKAGATAAGGTRPSHKGKSDKRGPSNTSSRPSQLLADWYIVDGLLKHFRSRALKEEKDKKTNPDASTGVSGGESPSAVNGGAHHGPNAPADPAAAAPVSLAATLIHTLSDAIPMLIDRYLPRRAEFPTSSTAQPEALKELERFRDMVRTWKHVVPRVTVQMAATQLGLA